jgi:hypothetical protein
VAPQVGQLAREVQQKQAGAEGGTNGGGGVLFGSKGGVKLGSQGAEAAASAAAAAGGKAEGDKVPSRFAQQLHMQRQAAVRVGGGAARAAAAAAGAAAASFPPRPDLPVVELSPEEVTGGGAVQWSSTVGV